MRTEGDMRHFLNLSDAGGDAVAAMLSDAIDRKAALRGWPKAKPDADRPLADHVLAMVFEKNSTRTRASFDIAIRQLGGTPMILDAGTTQLGRGETIADTARRSEEHTSELQSLMRISYAVFCLKKKNNKTQSTYTRKIR